MIGTRLADRYEVLAELGRGGMGVVYRAKDPVLNRDVAVKLIPPGNLTKDAEERFQREAQIVAQMDHPGIVPIYDFGRHEGALFFVMPVLPGTNLRGLLREGSLRLGDVLDVGTQVAEALDYSHARSIVHRDIKPENIMTAREESGHVRARVADFGLALASSEDRLTKTGTLVGTVSYFSPEQVTSRSFDGRTDTYALGTVLYECLAGEPPFSGEVQAVLYRIVHELPRSLRTVGADVGEELESIVLQALEKDPEKRPRRAGHLAEALRRYRSKLHEEEFTRSVVLTASRMIARPQPGASPFVGREKEIAELQRRLHAAVAGECQFVVVGGEPGIGKSRLVEQLVNLARARKIRVLQGRFVEHDRAFAHQGLCELIQDFFRTKDAGSSATSRPDFSDLADDLLALFPVLGEIGELQSGRSGEAKPGAESRRAEDKTSVFELLARALTRIAQGRPLLLVLDNLQVADASIEALQYIVRRLAPTPTLIVGTYRQTEVDKRHPLLRMLESFGDDSRFSSFTLGPISPSEHRALVEVVAGASSLTPSLAERLYEASEGNPFFTKELVRSLLDSGGIAKDDTGGLQLSGAAGFASDVLPTTIQQAVEKRIERLPDEVRDVLATASVLGKSFDYRDLEALAEEVEDLDDATDRLLREGILEEERESRGDRLAFASGIVRDVLYAGLSRRNRRSLHRKYAEILESQNADRLELVFPELVHHYSQGDVPEKTVEYGLALARRSLEAFSPEEATRVVKTALEFLEDKGWRGDRSLQGEARLLLARALQMTASLDGALREAEAAARVFEKEKKPDRAIAAMLTAAEVAWQGRRLDETRRWVDRGIEASFGGGGQEHLSHLLALAITVANLRGEYQKAAAYQAQLDRLSSKEEIGADQIVPGGRLVVAIANPTPASEPALSQTIEEEEVLGSVFETLLATDGEGSLVPGLAEEWELLDGGRRARLRLRRGVTFSDGAPLTAEAVKASLSRAIRIRPDGLLPALGPVRGAAEHRDGTASDVAGIRVLAEDRLEIELVDPLPIYGALLSDARTAIVRSVPGPPPEGERLLGTGPFQLARRSGDQVILERNPHYWREAARLDGVEFRTGMSASAIASGLRSGEIDLARDLLPQDLEALLREPRLKAGLVEVPKKNTYFVLLNERGPAALSSAVRRALTGSVRSQDFVWATLGRFALPATGLIPPGILGHDPGRRRPLIPKEAARASIESSGSPLPLTLRATVHPILRDRYRSLTDELFAVWRELGVSVEIGTPTMAEYLDSWQNPAGFDFMVGRWNADYDDPDDFTFGLFHSRASQLRTWYSSAEADRILEEARAETRRPARESLYRRFEELLLDQAVFIPLFHDVDYRIASPNVRGVALRSTPPFVSYGEIGKVRGTSAGALRVPAAGGVLHVPITGRVQSLEPSIITTNEQTETLTPVFEMLTKIVEGARISPWLASEVEAESGGMRYRFRLRRGVRFHDGRALTARDVRYSFERLLQNREADTRWLLSPVRGAKAVIEGERTDLEGFLIVSPHEFTIDLDRPISFFPAIVSYPSMAILPEGSVRVGNHWREGCAATGPFRVVRFEPGERLELERNPNYWREGYPRSEGLVFRFGVPPEEIKTEFLAGRFSIASDLLPADAEAFRNDARFASGYRESPCLSTYYVAFNSLRGPLKSRELRRRIVDGIDFPSLVRRLLGRIAIPASGLIPPGLLGHVSHADRPSRTVSPPVATESVALTAALHPIFTAEYGAFGQELIRAFREIGIDVNVLNRTMPEYLDLSSKGGADLDIGRWIADFPDADTFIHGILHSREGSLGRFCGRPDLDVLAERGRSEADPSIRHGVYRQAEEILAAESLLVPLFHESVYRFARPEVEGLSVSISATVVDYANLRKQG